MKGTWAHGSCLKQEKKNQRSPREQEGPAPERGGSAGHQQAACRDGDGGRRGGPGRTGETEDRQRCRESRDPLPRRPAVRASSAHSPRDHGRQTASPAARGRGDKVGAGVLTATRTGREGEAPAAGRKRATELLPTKVSATGPPPPRPPTHKGEAGPAPAPILEKTDLGSAPGRPARDAGKSLRMQVPQGTAPRAAVPTTAGENAAAPYTLPAD